MTDNSPTESEQPLIETDRIVILHNSQTAHLLAPEGVICGQSLTRSHGRCHVLESNAFDPSWMRLCSHCRGQVTDRGDSPGIVRARMREALDEDFDGRKPPRGPFEYRELRELLSIVETADD